MKPNGNTILVTGGGSGIGMRLAQAFHDNGNTVIIAGRRQAALDAAIAGRSRIYAYTFDVESREDVRALAEEVTTKHPDLNVLINNAGIMRHEPIDTARDLADAEAQITTNLLGPIRLIDALVGHLKTKDNSAIINVSSGLAFVPIASAAVYSATKAAIHSYTQSLRKALEGRVEVIELAPPAVRTGLTPGQEQVEAYMPLDDFVSEAMALLTQQPTPSEVIVERTKLFRNAEAEGRFPHVFAMLNNQ